MDSQLMRNVEFRKISRPLMSVNQSINQSINQSVSQSVSQLISQIYSERVTHDSIN